MSKSVALKTRIFQDLQGTVSGFLPQGLWRHILLLLPLAAIQLLQRMEHIIDNRFMGTLGLQSLAIHNVQFNFFLIGQAIGLAAATSALIFWNREEVRSKQGSILKSHCLITFVVASAVALLLMPLTSQDGRFGILREFFGISNEFGAGAELYFNIGLENMVLQAVYAPLGAMLIASGRHIQGMLLTAGILGTKFIVGLVAVNFFWNGRSEASSIVLPMALIALGTTIALFFFGGLALRILSRLADGWNKISLKNILPVWSSEIGIASIRSISPILFSLQLAKANASAGFFITYQLALHLSYILCLPLLAGSQIAIRDASAELSETPNAQSFPLNSPSRTSWFSKFLWASLVPTILLLFLATLLCVPAFYQIYGYHVPEDHQSFLPLYFSACIMGQLGNVYLIKLRALKKNWLATRNFFLAELGIQIGVTQFLLFRGTATPSWIGAVMVCYCTGYFVLNLFAVRSLQKENIIL